MEDILMFGDNNAFPPMPWPGAADAQGMPGVPMWDDAMGTHPLFSDPSTALSPLSPQQQQPQQQGLASAAAAPSSPARSDRPSRASARLARAKLAHLDTSLDSDMLVKQEPGCPSVEDEASVHAACEAVLASQTQHPPSPTKAKATASTARRGRRSASTSRSRSPETGSKRARRRRRREAEDSVPETALTLPRDRLLKISSADFEAWVEERTQGRELTHDEVLDVRRQKRLIKNRESALASRTRKRRQLDCLQVKLDSAEAANADLARELQAERERAARLEAENARLRAAVSSSSSASSSFGEPAIAASAFMPSPPLPDFEQHQLPLGNPFGMAFDFASLSAKLGTNLMPKALGGKPATAGKSQASSACLLLLLFSCGIVFGAVHLGGRGNGMYPFGGPANSAGVPLALQGLGPVPKVVPARGLTSAAAPTPAPTVERLQAASRASGRRLLWDAKASSASATCTSDAHNEATAATTGTTAATMVEDSIDTKIAQHKTAQAPRATPPVAAALVEAARDEPVASPVDMAMGMDVSEDIATEADTMTLDATTPDDGMACEVWKRRQQLSSRLTTAAVAAAAAAAAASNSSWPSPSEAALAQSPEPNGLSPDAGCDASSLPAVQLMCLKAQEVPSASASAVPTRLDIWVAKSSLQATSPLLYYATDSDQDMVRLPCNLLPPLTSAPPATSAATTVA